MKAISHKSKKPESWRYSKSITSFKKLQKLIVDKHPSVFKDNEVLALMQNLQNDLESSRLNSYNLELFQSLDGDQVIKTLMQTGDFSFIISGSGTICRVSQSVEDYLKVSMEQIVGKHIYSLIPFLDEQLEENGNTSEGEVKVIINSTDALWVKLKKVPLCHQEINTEYCLLQCYDLTQTKVEEQALRNENEGLKRKRAQEAEFLGRMSHEIRSPINGILGFSELLSHTSLSDEKRKKYAQLIESSTNQLNALLSDLMDISKIEAGALKIVKKNFNVFKLLDELNSYYQCSTAKLDGNIAFKMEYDESPELNITQDAVRVKQVFSNLIENALKFTDNGSITIGCRFKDNHLTCYVKDTGMGIPDSEKPNIFELYSQVENHNEGKGIGLSICKKLVELMGGEITVKDNEPTGSIFAFSLPG